MKKEKKKLMVVTPYFYPESGGVANHTYNLYKRVAKKNYEIIIITSGKKNEIMEENLEGMKVYRLPRQFKISNTPISFGWKKQIKDIIEKEKPDLILGHMPVAFICDITLPLSLKEKVPFIIKYHHGGSMKKGKFPIDILIGLYETIFLKRIFKRSNKIITSSEFVKKIFLNKYLDKTMVITPAVDIKLFKPSRSNPKNRILFVGNLKKSENYKGLNYLLESMSLIKNKNSKIKLIVVGDGDYRHHYEKLSKDLGIEENVEFKGELKERELIKEYNNINILVLPSLMESFGMVLIEAMACKKPVIGSNIGGIPYVIDDGKNGLLVPPKDPQALAGAIMKILENPKLAKQMGENGYKKVKDNFTWDKKVIETEKIVENILA